jgi:hypothetical protein
MNRNLRKTPQKLPVLLALVWLCAQTFLAWHAPSHIAANASHFNSGTFGHIEGPDSDAPLVAASSSTLSDSSPINDRVNDTLGAANQDCQFGVNGHGVAVITAITVVECRPAQQPTLFTQNESHSYTSAQFTQPRAPPTSA